MTALHYFVLITARPDFEDGLILRKGATAEHVVSSYSEHCWDELNYSIHSS
jgi:hypothetical protein